MLEDVLKEWNGAEVDAVQVYSDVFRLGEGYIQKSGRMNDRKSNPLVYMKNDNRQKGEYRVLLEDTFFNILQEAAEADFAITNGLTYWGRKNLQAAADRMFAMIFDLDGVTDETLTNFFSGAYRGMVYPLPNYVVLSGHGVHLYYLFEEPLQLYPNVKTFLKELKYALTLRMWNRYTSTERRPQLQGINQGFRPVGCHTKIPGVRVRAFMIHSHPYTMLQLYRYVSGVMDMSIDDPAIYRESKMTLAEAEKKYPEWYQKRIVEGDTSKGHWICKRDLYDWWKRQIAEGAMFGHRYFCTMMLAIYGMKCGLPYEEVEADALAFIPFMNSLAAEPFTEADVQSALECFDERYFTFPRHDIARLSGIQIPKNKRNGQRQADHLEEARAIRDIRSRRRGESWDAHKGRKPGSGNKRAVVEEWQRRNPGKRKADCMRETGISRMTVDKYWKIQSKQEIVERWQQQNPEKRKADCIRATGISRMTVSKYWNPEPAEKMDKSAE